MRLVAIAEIDAERRVRATERWAPEFAFQDYREMLDRVALDVVYVVTMPGHLLPIVVECLGRGLHTSVEKSPGMNAGETRQMLEAARKSKGKAILSVNRRYIPQVLAVRRLLQERGGAAHVAAIYHKPPWALSSAAWRELAPPPIVCDAIHHVDLLRWMAGRTGAEAAAASEVFAHSWQGPREGGLRYNAAIAFDNGCHGTMTSLYGVGFRIQAAEVHAEEMSAYLDLTGPPQVTLYLDGKLSDAPLDLDAVGGPKFNETRHFADCILNDTEPWSPLEDAVRTMELAEVIEQGHVGKMEGARGGGETR
jgi:predicted dehydrogenase